MTEALEVCFPGLQTSPYQVTSPATRDYNCIAWAAGDTAHWRWPQIDPDNDAIFWPAYVPLEETLGAFVAAFATLGYVPAASVNPEPGFERVALFTRDGIPTHAARQLASGRWTTKLGMREDVEHELDAVSGAVYGTVALILRRPAQTSASNV